MDINNAPRAELVRLIYEMADRIQLLEGEIARLQEQLHQKGKKDDSMSAVQSFVKPNTKKKKVKKRKKRETQYTRKREIPTERIFHSAQKCIDCGGKLGIPTVAYSRQIIDIPISIYTITEHVVFRRWCYACKKCVQPDVNPASGALGKGRIGINLAAIIVTMRERLRLPLGIIRQYLKLFYQLKLSEGEIVKILHSAARLGKPLYNGLFRRGAGI